MSCVIPVGGGGWGGGMGVWRVVGGGCSGWLCTCVWPPVPSYLFTPSPAFKPRCTPWRFGPCSTSRNPMLLPFSPRTLLPLSYCSLRSPNGFLVRVPRFFITPSTYKVGTAGGRLSPFKNVHPPHLRRHCRGWLVHVCSTLAELPLRAAPVAALHLLPCALAIHVVYLCLHAPAALANSCC